VGKMKPPNRQRRKQPRKQDSLSALGCRLCTCPPHQKGSSRKAGPSPGPHCTSSAYDGTWHVVDKQELSVEGMNEQTTSYTEKYFQF